jgi:hypothetical protein
MGLLTDKFAAIETGMETVNIIMTDVRNNHSVWR